MIKVDNAIILAAGASSRFAPLSYEHSKALTMVKDEVLIERQIKQLKEAKIEEIVVVTGYKSEQLQYLQAKYQVILVHNPDYATRNNHASIYHAKKYLKNSYICSADNYFQENPFNAYEEAPFYSACYSQDKTAEWCVSVDGDGYIDKVKIGGEASWYMLGHVFWDQKFSEQFLDILTNIYDQDSTKNLLWEAIYMQHLDKLKLKIKKFPQDHLFEFDSLAELQLFDTSYINDTRSKILKSICDQLKCQEKDIYDIEVLKDQNDIQAIGFKFKIHNKQYQYLYQNMQIDS